MAATGASTQTLQNDLNVLAESLCVGDYQKAAIPGAGAGGGAGGGPANAGSGSGGSKPS